MALARANPLAPGVYFIDIFKPFSTFRDVEAPMLEWLRASSGSVIVRRREERHLTTPGGQVPAFYVFEVLEGPPPAPFPFRELGFPTVVKLASAPGGITAQDRATTSADTVQRPPPFTPGDFLAELEDELAPTLDRFLPWIVIGVALYLWAQTDSRGRDDRHVVH